MSDYLLALMTATMPQNVDPREDLLYFNWMDFGLGSLAYSAFVFSGELSKDGPLIFSKRNRRSTSVVLTSHCAFLVILLCLLRIFTVLIPSLPYWMTDTFNAGRGGRVSIADLVFIALASGLVYCERKWLYVESTS